MHPRSLIVHIGLEKTGTTSLQHFCSDHTALLLRHGLHYPTRNAGFGLFNHANVAAAYLDDRPQDFTLTTSRVTQKQVVASLLTDIARNDAPTVLISAEHLSSRFDRSKAERFARDIAQFDTRIAITVRNHRARFFSSYSTYIWGGGEMTIEAYADHMLQPDDPYFRVKETMSIWVDVFGSDRIDLFDYDAVPDIVPVVIGRYARSPVPAVARRPYRDKPSLRPAAAEGIRLANRLVTAKQADRHDHSYIRWLQRRYFQRLIAYRILAQAPVAGDRWRLGEDIAARLDAIAAADRQWLDDRFGFRMTDVSAAEGVARPGEDAGGAAAGVLAQALVEASVRRRWWVGEALATVGVAVERLRAGRSAP